jgi:protein required for attachment to host cells
MLLPHGTIVALVDGRHFELHRNTGTESEPDLAPVPTPSLDEHNKGAGTGHHTSTGNPDGHIQDEDAHVAAAAGWLNGEAQAGRITSLVVIAPPRALGEMRRHYTRHLEDVLLKDLPKDLIGQKGPALLAALRA